LAPRASEKYNLRSYVKRRALEDFRSNRLLGTPDSRKALDFGREQLAIVQRQAAIRNMYGSRPSVIEELVKTRRTKP